VVAQRESAKATAAAVVAQRQSELALAEKELTRSQQLAFKGAGSQQQLDTDYTRYKSTTAALSAAQSQLLEAQSAIAAAKSQAAETQSAMEVAKSQVVEAQSAIEAALATTERLKAEIEDSVLKAPRSGRVQYRVAQPGEVLPAGGKILTILDLSDVYMTFFLPETLAGRVAIGAETRVVLDAAPQYVFPARVSFVASVAQFTPKDEPLEAIFDPQHLPSILIDGGLHYSADDRIEARAIPTTREDTNAPNRVRHRSDLPLVESSEPSCSSSLFCRRGARPMLSLTHTLNTRCRAVLYVHPRIWGTKHPQSSERAVLSLNNLP
jgi:HlyD family secretion protein